MWRSASSQCLHGAEGRSDSPLRVTIFWLLLEYRMPLLHLLLGVAVATDAALPNRAARIPTDAAKAVFIADEAAAKRGGLSEVAVLGSSHLSSLPKDFDMRHLAGLIDKLAA